MHLLLNGNGSASRDGGVSPQLKARLSRALAYLQGPNHATHLHFLADDRYPCGRHAADYVQTILDGRGISRSFYTIEPCARSTAAEVDAFLERVKRIGYDGALGAVTSYYHAYRVGMLFRLRGHHSVRVVGTGQFGWLDCTLEPLKIFKDALA